MKQNVSTGLIAAAVIVLVLIVGALAYFNLGSHPGDKTNGVGDKAATPSFQQQYQQRVMQERTALEDQLTSIARIEQEIDDQVMMIDLGEAENDKDVVAESENHLRALKAEAARRELEALLSGEADNNEGKTPPR